jgi:hypothetical protein
MLIQEGFNILVSAGTRTGTTGSDEASAGVMLGVILCYGIVLLAYYVYLALCTAKIAEKGGYPDQKLLAWIPILNIIPLLKVANKEIWWIVLFFIPFVNWVVTIIVWMEVAKNLGHPSWLGILLFVPVIGFFVPGYIAFAEGSNTNTV